jgi:hypothetical protein
VSHGYDRRRNGLNETTEMYREIRQDEQKKHADRKEANLSVLRASTLPFKFQNAGDVVLVRHRGYPAIDFWPTVNKWRVGDRYMMGDAQALIDFLKRRALK